MHEYERKAILSVGTPPEQGGYYKHRSLLLKQKPKLSSTQIDRLNALRNAFCHGEYPPYGLFAGAIDGNGFNSISSYTKDSDHLRARSVAHQFITIIQQEYDHAISLL